MELGDSGFRDGGIIPEAVDAMRSALAALQGGRLAWTTEPTRLSVDVSAQLDKIKLRAVAVAMMAGQLQHSTFSEDQSAALEFAADEVADMLSELLAAVQRSLRGEREKCSYTPAAPTTAPA